MTDAGDLRAGASGTSSPREPAARRPVRALLQRAASALAVALLLGAALVLLHGGLVVAPPMRVTDDPVPLADAAQVAHEDGRMLGETLAAIDAALVDVAGELVALSVGRPDGRHVPIELEVDVATGAEGIARVLAALDRAGVSDAVPRTVAPAPVGVRASISGTTRPAVRRLPASPSDGRALAVRLAEDVELAAVDLRHLDVAADGVDAVRLELEGRAEVLARLVTDIERRYAAPARVVALDVRVLEGGRQRLTIVFRPRTAAAP